MQGGIRGGEEGTEAGREEGRVGGGKGREEGGGGIAAELPINLEPQRQKQKYSYLTKSYRNQTFWNIFRYYNVISIFFVRKHTKGMHCNINIK